MPAAFFEPRRRKGRKGVFVGLFLILKEKSSIRKAPGPDKPAQQTLRTWNASGFPAARHVPSHQIPYYSLINHAQ
jgi:hypothetical protein